MSMLFTGSSPQPATDHWLFTSTPTTQCPCIVNATAAGPKLNLPLPRSLSVAVGNVNVGPTPQISSPGFAGTRPSLLTPDTRNLITDYCLLIYRKPIKAVYWTLVQ